MKNYYRVMLGKKSAFAEQCFAGNFIGAHFGIAEDLSDKLPEAWREFNKAFIPVFLAARPDKTKIGAGLACGALWTVAKGIRKGDIVLSPDGAGAYRVGEVTGDYQYAPGQVLPHRRPVQWFSQSTDRWFHWDGQGCLGVSGGDREADRRRLRAYARIDRSDRGSHLGFCHGKAP